jgi:hypothetical protein
MVLMRTSASALSEERHSGEHEAGNDLARSRLAACVIRWRWGIVAICLALLLPPILRGDQGDWFDFVRGSRLLFGGAAGGGLHLFAHHPELQVGPLSLVVSAAVREVSSGNGFVSAVLLTMGLGIVTLFLVERIAARLRPGATVTVAVALGAPLFLKQWGAIASIGHVDDALALAFGTLAVYAVAERWPTVAGCAVGLAVGSKPWAVFFLPVLWALPRYRARSVVIAGVVSAAAWLPFVLADSHTLSAGAYTIYNWPDSTLRVLGVGSLRTPEWVRPAQLIACLAVGAVAAWRRRWYAVPLAAIATRMLLDGGTWGYYAAGLVLGALLVDAIASTRTVPWATIFVFGTIRGLPLLVHVASTRGPIRTAVLLLCVGVALVGAGGGYELLRSWGRTMAPQGSKTRGNTRQRAAQDLEGTSVG